MNDQRTLEQKVVDLQAEAADLKARLEKLETPAPEPVAEEEPDEPHKKHRKGH